VSEAFEKGVVDRIEDGQHAVLIVSEAGREREQVVPVGKLPAGAAGGTWLRVRFVGNVLSEAETDREETERVRARVHDKISRLRRRGRRHGDTSGRVE
jgi:hypothetical protein